MREDAELERLLRQLQRKTRAESSDSDRGRAGAGLYFFSERKLSA